MPRSFKEIGAGIHLGFTQRGFDSPLVIHENLVDAWRNEVAVRAKSPDYLLCLVPIMPNVQVNSLTDTPYASRAREFTEELRFIMGGRLIVFNDAPTPEEISATIAREDVRASKNASFRYWGEVLEECVRTYGGRIARGFGISQGRMLPVRELSITKREEEVICELRAGLSLRQSFVS